MRINRNIILGVLMLGIGQFLTSCHPAEKKYVIGVSQCSEDSWRSKLQDELIMATYFNEDVQLILKSANDDSRLQEKQIDSLVEMGVDLLIVSPNQVNNLTETIGKVYDRGIPVVLFDRKTSDDKFTTFMGADNYIIGEMLAHYLATKLEGKGNIVEIGGLVGSSPAQERHDGFSNALKKYPDMHIVAYESGDWTESSGELAMQRILKKYDGHIDAVFGGNDRMAIGARRVIRERGREHGQILYIGVDALPTENGGLRQVADSLLTASALYPTHGDELLQLAIDVLEGRSVPHDILMKSSIVTSENAKVLLLQHDEVVRQAANLRKMHVQAGIMHQYIRNQRIVIGVIAIMVLIAIVHLVFAIRSIRSKHRLNGILQEKNQELEASQQQISEANEKLSAINAQLSITNEQLMHEKEVAERQRDELEEQRDKIIEMTLTQKVDDVEATGEDIISGNEKQFRRENEFYDRFIGIIHEHLADSELSVEDIGEEMCLSRVQLYRKVKALTGKSPVEIIREERLSRGHQLLTDSSLNISEIAYRVGFSSPSYFTKCYKDMFGKSPTNVQKA